MLALTSVGLDGANPDPAVRAPRVLGAGRELRLFRFVRGTRASPRAITGNLGTVVDEVGAATRGRREKPGRREVLKSGYSTTADDARAMAEPRRSRCPSSRCHSTSSSRSAAPSCSWSRCRCTRSAREAVLERHRSDIVCPFSKDLWRDFDAAAIAALDATALASLAGEYDVAPIGDGQSAPTSPMVSRETQE